METIGEVSNWIIGTLGAVVLFSWRYDKKSDNDKFKSLFDTNVAVKERLAKVETKVAAMDKHLQKTLDEIKAGNANISEEVTAIRIIIAGMPKRKHDDDD